MIEGENCPFLTESHTCLIGFKPILNQGKIETPSGCLLRAESITVNGCTMHPRTNITALEASSEFCRLTIYSKIDGKNKNPLELYGIPSVVLEILDPK